MDLRTQYLSPLSDFDHRRETPLGTVFIRSRENRVRPFIPSGQQFGAEKMGFFRVNLMSFIEVVEYYLVAFFVI